MGVVPVTPRQFSALIEKTGLRKPEAAKLLGIHTRTIYKFTSGESEVPRTVEYAMRWIAHCGADEHRLKTGDP